MLGFIGAVIIGFFAGLIARAIHPGNDKAGFIVTVLLGIAGSLAATYGGQLIGWYEPNEKAGFIMSVLGAVVILAIYNFVKRKTA